MASETTVIWGKTLGNERGKWARMLKSVMFGNVILNFSYFFLRVMND
jgi:hypothetical protein